MTADELQRAVELAREVIAKYPDEPDKPSVRLAHALFAVHAECERMRPVLAKLVECFDDGSLSVEHVEIERATPSPRRIGNADSGDAWFEPICGDDHDACSRETCPAIWVVNDAARIVNAEAPTAGRHRQWTKSRQE